MLVGVAQDRLAQAAQIADGDEPDRAVEAFLKALEVDSYHYFARKNLAFAYMRLQDYVSAQREFELLLRVDDTDADVVRSLSFLRNRK